VLTSASLSGTFLGAAGIYPTIPNTLTWASNNIEGVYKRGVIIGIVVGWGNLNGVISSNIYMPTEKPRYWTGHGLVLAYLIVCLLGGTIFMYIMLNIENRKRLSGQRDRMHDGLTGMLSFLLFADLPPHRLASSLLTSFCRG
jgi:hypothetical protein